MVVNAEIVIYVVILIVVSFSSFFFGFRVSYGNEYDEKVEQDGRTILY